MAVCTLNSIVFLILLAEATVVQSKIRRVSHASFVVYQKLEIALATNHEVLYLLQEALFPSQGLNRGDWLDLAMCVMVDSVQPEYCEKTHFFVDRVISHTAGTLSGAVQLCLISLHTTSCSY